LLTVAGMTKWQLHTVETEYKEYKDNVNDQLSKAKIEKARIEAEQKAKHDSEIADYAADVDRLNRILNGLRKPKVVSGNETLRVAGTDSSIMPGKAEDTARTLKDFATAARTGCPAFYSEAMKDALQCHHLIEFVR